MKGTLSILLTLWSLASIGQPLTHEFTYQGSLTQEGVPAQGTYDLEFLLFDQPSDGLPLNMVLLENVAVIDGVFSVDLNFGPGTFVGDQLWLEIGVREGGSSETFTTLLPRQALRAAPYALHAERVATDAIGSREIANDSIAARDIAPDAVGLSEIDTGAVQARIFDTCAVGQSLLGVGADGSANCSLTGWNANEGNINYTGGRVAIGLKEPEADLHVVGGASVLFGSAMSGPGDRLMFSPALQAFRVGSIDSGISSDYWDEANVGRYSFASGLNTRAQGFVATALGRDTEASESYAFATGFFSNAKGLYATAMGFQTDALAQGSTALGYNTEATANYSTSAGYFSNAEAIYSVAIGNHVQAQSYSSMAIGRYNVGGGSAATWVSSDPIFEIGVGTGSDSRANAITVTKNGRVGIGTANPLGELQVNGRIWLKSAEYFEDGGNNEIGARGDIRPTADNIYDLGTSGLRYDDLFVASGVVNTSDARAKKDVASLRYGLHEVLSLSPVAFRYKNDLASDPLRLGLLAQDVLPLMPELVKTHNREVDEESGEPFEVELKQMGLYYSALIPVLVRAIQEQQEQITALKKEASLRQ